MPSFLVTKHMSPALAARVLDSVRGRTGSGRGGLKPLRSLLRLATFVFLVTAVAIVLFTRHQRAQKLEQARATLLQAMRGEASSLTKSDRELRSRVEAALSAHSVAGYPGDFSAEELRSAPGLAAELALPTLYIRGPLDGLASPTRLAQLAPSSWKDAFVLCLLDPPEARTEKALKAKARAAFVRGKSLQLVEHVERLDPLLQALPLLGPAWQERVKSAGSATQLHGLQKLFDVAPIKAAVRAAKARQLLAVMDEPGDPKGPTELDGERPHPVRVTLTDLSTGQLRLRFRRDVDPSWISPTTRAEYASGIDSCALALDLRAAVTVSP